MSGFNLANTFALDISALKFGVELASLNILVYFGTLIVFDIQEVDISLREILEGNNLAKVCAKHTKWNGMPRLCEASV